MSLVSIIYLPIYIHIPNPGQDTQAVRAQRTSSVRGLPHSAARAQLTSSVGEVLPHPKPLPPHCLTASQAAESRANVVPLYWIHQVWELHVGAAPCARQCAVGLLSQAL